MIGGKVHSSKRMSIKRKSKSPKRKSSKRKSPKTSAWIRKLSAWRKAHRHVDGSLPSMKSAMKHCKGRSASKTKCRKNQGRKASPKRKSKSPKRKSASPKRKTSAKKTKSPKRKSNKKKSPKRKSNKKKSPKRKTSAKKKSPKKKSTKKRSYTRKPKAMPLLSAQRDELSQFRRYGPRLQQAAALRQAANAPFAGPAKKYQQQQQLSALFGQALPQGMQKFQQQQGAMFGPQTRQQSQARQARQAFEQLPGAKQEQGGLLGLFGF